jgi:hypothetical protein
MNILDQDYQTADFATTDAEIEKLIKDKQKDGLFLCKHMV